MSEYGRWREKESSNFDMFWSPISLRRLLLENIWKDSKGSTDGFLDWLKTHPIDVTKPIEVIAKNAWMAARHHLSPDD